MRPLIVDPDSHFKTKMAFAPKNKFFETEAEYLANMEKRLKFCEHLARASVRHKLFKVSDDFIKDFIERND
jgi:hypothetical protein